MRREINDQLIQLHDDDITRMSVDSIVNAANTGLRGGGGVDGAIHRVGGPSIMQETARRYPDGCPTGSAVISSAGELPAKFVIHTVGPIWRGGRSGEEKLLASAYHSSLELAVDNQCRSIAFPALSAGAYQYPIDMAARTGLSTVIEFLQGQKSLESVHFVLFGADTYAAFSAALEELTIE